MNFNDDDTLAIGQLKKFANLYLARKKIREKDKELTARLMEMQTPLIDHLLDHGLLNLPLKGGNTISMRPRIVPKMKNGATREQVMQALIRDGLGDLVSDNYNTNQLSSYLSDLEKSDEPLPKHLSEVIEIDRIINLVVTGEK